jgi:DNA-binding LytR/AlgR family response regulator
MGKILNIYSTYNKFDQRILRRVEEERLSYSADDRTMKSVFIIGTRNEESTRIVFDNVLYIKKVGNQVCVCFDDDTRKYFRSNLKLFMSKFPKSRFQKINRSVVVNMDKVTRVIKNRVLIADNANFEVSRSFKKSFKQRLPV